MENVTQTQNDTPEFVKFQGELKKVFDDVNEQMKSQGSKVDKALQFYDTFTQEVKSLKESLLKIETKANAQTVATPEDNLKLMRKQFNDYIRHGNKDYYK